MQRVLHLTTCAVATAGGLDFAALNAAGAFGDGVIVGPAIDRVLMPKRSAAKHPPQRYAPLLSVSTLPESFDWRARDTPPIVTRVKDQGTVGSCWSFSATGQLEGAYALAHNKSVPLSEEFLVDCDSLDCSVF